MAGNFISLETAISMTSRYRADKTEILKAQYADQNLLANSETFDRDFFEKLLNQAGCAALRIYYGMGGDLKVHAIIVAVDANDNDIVDLRTPDSNATEDILDEGVRCPPICPPPSPLNS